MKRLGPQAHLINLKLNHTVPASVRLLPAKEYRGAAIGINYDLRVYTGMSEPSGLTLWLAGKETTFQGQLCYLDASKRAMFSRWAAAETQSRRRESLLGILDRIHFFHHTLLPLKRTKGRGSAHVAPLIT